MTEPVKPADTPDPTGYPFPRQPPPVPATEPKSEPKRSKSGRYAMPMVGEQSWIDINDMEKMYSVFTIHRVFPDAEKLALEAWKRVEEL